MDLRKKKVYGDTYKDASHANYLSSYHRAVDPHSFFADPDPAVFLHVDPDPALQTCEALFFC